MLRKQPWLRTSDGLDIELLQASDEGKDVKSLEERVRQILSLDDPDPGKQSAAEQIFKEIEALPVSSEYPYDEPSDLDGIKAARKAYEIKSESGLPDNAAVYDKVYGAWLGRCAGCLLGQPIEGWHRERIIGFLKETGNYPVKDYLSSNVSPELREKYKITDEGRVYGSNHINWINNVKCMPEDDDTNYTVIGMKILEEYGFGFTPDDVAECWLANLPILHVCTAERAAYKNLVNSVFPPESASFMNPYREWIGAQIRADFFGYVTPGNPELGAELAWRDASISHVKNGIYGEMFVAAMLSAAAVSRNVTDVLMAGLSQVPFKSRLYEKVSEVMRWNGEGMSWEQVLDRIHSLYDEKIGHHWCHTVSNAMIVAAGLIYGELDLAKSIGIAVSGALDTDCNGATVGSIVGMMLGAKKLPGKWTTPLSDHLISGVDGFGKVKISELASRTVMLIDKAK